MSLFKALNIEEYKKGMKQFVRKMNTEFQKKKSFNKHWKHLKNKKPDVKRHSLQVFCSYIHIGDAFSNKMKEPEIYKF